MNIEMLKSILDSCAVEDALERHPEKKGEKYYTDQIISVPLARELGIIVENPRVLWNTNAIQALRVIFIGSDDEVIANVSLME
jgi:hypothetical protein